MPYLLLRTGGYINLSPCNGGRFKDYELTPNPFLLIDDDYAVYLHNIRLYKTIMFTMAYNKRIAKILKRQEEQDVINKTYHEIIKMRINGRKQINTSIM